MVCASPVIIIGNTFRAAALFYIEAGIANLPLPEWTHEGVGVVVFTATAIGIALVAKRLAKKDHISIGDMKYGIGNMTYRSSFFFITCCLLAAVVPIAPIRSDATYEQSAFPGWPARFDGRSLTQLRLSSREERFAADFPGRIARFSDGRREIIIRWVARETRALHPASHCFKGLGYSIKPLPARIDPAGHHWGGFEARRGSEALRIHERIYDSTDKESWSDVSSWYWQAMMGKTGGGWWAVTMAEIAGSD